MDTLATARSFFNACDYGKGWEECKKYCHDGATFETEAETLAGVDRMNIYCDWMVDALAMFDENVEIEFEAAANNQTRDIGPFFAEICNKITVDLEPLFANTGHV